MSSAICSPMTRRSMVDGLLDDFVQRERPPLNDLLATVSEQLASETLWRARRRAPPAAAKPLSFSSSCGSRSCSAVLPRMTVRMLLKSCATPAASRPTASIFCAWRSSFSSRIAIGDVLEDEQLIGLVAEFEDLRRDQHFARARRCVVRIDDRQVANRRGARRVRAAIFASSLGIEPKSSRIAGQRLVARSCRAR